MGPVVDRTEEHLGSTDKAIVAARLLLLQAAKSVGKKIDPPGIGPSYYRLRAIEKVLPHNSHWRTAMKDEICPKDRLEPAVTIDPTSPV
jgi:phthalate 4,5-dioxygenase